MGKWSDGIEDQFKTIGDLKKHIGKKKYWHICMRCGRTIDSVNKDGECKQCVKEQKGFSTFGDQERMFGY